MGDIFKVQDEDLVIGDLLQALSASIYVPECSVEPDEDPDDMLASTIKDTQPEYLAVACTEVVSSVFGDEIVIMFNSSEPIFISGGYYMEVTGILQDANTRAWAGSLSVHMIASTRKILEYIRDHINTSHQTFDSFEA